MPKNPAIHILVPTYNVAPFIHSSITSILKQDYPEITTIILDDGSQDSTQEDLVRMTANGGSFKLFFEAENQGIATRREQLIELSKELDPDSYFIWLDADDTLSEVDFVSRLIEQMTRTAADICLYNFRIAYENDSNELKNNSISLLNEKRASGKILSTIIAADEQVVSVDTYPEVATYSSLGWTKAYAPAVKNNWPKSDHRYQYEDFVYMAALFEANRITALEPDYKPITYLRRAESITGNRTPEHFYVDVIQQLLTFKKNLGELSPLRKKAADTFIKNKLKQYEDTLRSLIEFGMPSFSNEDLEKFEQAGETIINANSQTRKQ